MLKIRELRRDKDMTMKELGKILGLSESAISQYETGKREPDNATLSKLAEIFNCSIDYLLGRTDTPETANNILTETPFALSSDFTEEAKDLTEEEQKKVIEFIRFTKSQRD